jgi:hypothetical protein
LYDLYEEVVTSGATPLLYPTSCVVSTLMSWL